MDSSDGILGIPRKSKELSEEMCCLYARIDCAQCRPRMVEQAKQGVEVLDSARQITMQSSFCTHALGVLSQVGRRTTSSCCRLVDQGCKLHPLTLLLR